LTFDSKADQYIQISDLIPAAQDISITISISFLLYLKLDEVPASTTRILSYYCDSVGTDIFYLQISPNKKLTMGLYGDTVEPLETIALEKWNTIYLGFGITVGGFGIAKISFDGSDPEIALETENIPSTLVFFRYR